MKIKEHWLIVKVFIVHWLQRFTILPNVWYQCEIDLSKIRGKRMSDFFNNFDVLVGNK